MKRKLLSILLTLTMTLSIIPMFGGTALAIGGDVTIVSGEAYDISIYGAKYSELEEEGNIKDIHFIMENGDGEEVVFTNVDENFLLNEVLNTEDGVYISFTCTKETIDPVKVTYQQYSTEEEDWIEHKYNHLFHIMICSVATDEDPIHYSSIHAALEALDAGDYTESYETSTNITLLADAEENVEIDYDRNVVLDLNGHVLKGTGTSCVIKNYGNLTIKDTEDISNRTIHYFKVGENGLWKLTTSTDIATPVESLTSCPAGGTVVAVKGGCITGGSCIYGGAIANESDLTLERVNLIGNSSDEGGALRNSRTAYLNNTKIMGNTAKKGGGINSTTASKTVIRNAKIKYNVAFEQGGGVFDNHAFFGGCFIEGTKITMADGSVRNIEDITDDSIIRTFNHETGKLSQEKISYIYESDDYEKAFELHFYNDIDLSIVGEHGLFEKESGKYVNISASNAEDYIGKHFYNAINGCWEELLDVTVDAKYHRYFAIYSENDINSIANDMLTVVSDVLHYVNVFELDENLMVDQAKKQNDIAKYGLRSFETCFGAEKETYDDFNMEYSDIIIGKGLATEEQLQSGVEESNEYNDKNRNNEKSENTLLSKLVSLIAPEVAYAGTILLGDFTIGDDTVITDNYLVNQTKVITNNYYGGIEYVFASYLTIENSGTSTGINVGITLPNGTGQFTTNGAIGDKNSFFSDNEEYGIKYVAGNPKATDTDKQSNHLEVAICTVKVATGISNGKVEVSDACAEAGDSVMVMATPNTGYELETISVTDKDGNAITVENNEFVMPAFESLPVTVGATFKKKENKVKPVIWYYYHVAVVTTPKSDEKDDEDAKSTKNEISTTMETIKANEKEQAIDDISKLKIRANSKYVRRDGKRYIEVYTTIISGGKDLTALLKQGYTVKYEYYRGTSTKNSSFKKVAAVKSGKLIDKTGIDGRYYYYRVVFNLYDPEGDIITSTKLDQCKYGSRMYNEKAQKMI